MIITYVLAFAVDFVAFFAGVLAAFLAGVFAFLTGVLLFLGVGDLATGLPLVALVDLTGDFFTSFSTGLKIK